MDKLTGKTLIFTDLHCGLAGNKISRLNICVAVINEIAAAIEAEGVSNVIFAGDWFHNRNTLDLNTINVALKLIQKISKRCACYLIVGNHDAYLKNSTDINSLNIFRDTPNVRIVDKAEEVSLNGQRCIMVPWLTDLTKYGAETFDVAVGHFEISSRYLVQAYVEEHSVKTAAGEELRREIDGDGLLADGSSSESGSLIGSFVDLVRKNGYIYAGHIHSHKEFKARNRNFVFVGSPYEQNLGDIGNPRGYYVLDENNRPSFRQINDVPKHVQILMSEAVSGGYDFSKVRNNIVQKIYDVDVRQKDEAAVQQRINDQNPYEELISDYRVKIDFGGKAPDDSSVDLLKKSKVEYMKNYVDNIEQKVLDEKGLDRRTLFDVLAEYYRIVTGD